MNILGFDIKRVKPNSSKKGGRRHYEAADKGRRGKAFINVKNTGVNAEVLPALSVLRSRSRHKVRNDGWAKRAVEAVVKHTVGEGIRPAPIGTLKQKKQLKELWKRWAESTQCDFYGKTTLYGLQELAMRSVVEGGDCIVILRWVSPKRANELPIKLQLCEGDLIDHSRNGTVMVDGKNGVSRLGVHFSETGELLGYWLFNQHPGDVPSTITGLQASEFHPKENVLHVFELLRIGQVRGVPFGISSFMKLSDFSDYEDAQLTKQKVAACFSAFIGGTTTPADDEKEDDLFERLEAGTVERLGTDETITFSEPPTVGDYDNYSTRILQGIAAGYGITYEMLTMDYSRVNFTSGRMAKIDVTPNFRSWQYNMMVPMFCAPVWEWFIDACIVAGFLSGRMEADWTAPRVQQLDPVKETNSRVTQVQAGFATLSEIIREDGREPEEFFEEYKQDVERMKGLGIVLKSIDATPDTLNNMQNG